MMCDCCQQPMKPEASEPYEMPGATGPGTTLHPSLTMAPVPAPIVRGGRPSEFTNRH